jgi:hypothetical protein
MADSPQAQVQPPQQLQGDSLHPSQINYKQIKDVKLREEAAKKVEDWYVELEKDVHAVFTKHGISVYGMGLLHPGSGQYMPIHSEPFYEAAKATSAAALFMRRRVLTELKIDDGGN